MKIMYFKIPHYNEMALRQYQKIYNNSYKEYKKAFVTRNNSTLKALRNY